MQMVNKTAAEVKAAMLNALEEYAKDLAVASLRGGVSVEEIMRARGDYGTPVLGNIPDCYHDDIYKFISSFDEKREITLGDMFPTVWEAETPHVPSLLLAWQKLAIQGQKLQAIKELREWVGSRQDQYGSGTSNLSLKEAKDLVEDYMQRNGIS